MKLTEGLLKRTFEEVAKEYPDVQAWHVIVDNCAHQLVKKPEQFDVIVTTNMNGDILSDLTSALVGGLGFAPSANLGSEVAIFEAVHGSAPKYAGKNCINPTAVIGSAVMMLRHLGALHPVALRSSMLGALVVVTGVGPYLAVLHPVGDGAACDAELLRRLLRGQEDHRGAMVRFSPGSA